MLTEDECQAKSTERAANTDCGTVGKPRFTDYRPGIIATTVVRSESKPCSEETDPKMILRIHTQHTVGSTQWFCSIRAVA